MGNVHMEATQINYRGGASKMNVEEAIKSAIELTPEQKTNINKIPAIEAAVGTKTDQTVIAPEFDAEAGTYAIGDLVMYEGKLYEFTSAHETAGDWNAEEVSEKTVSDELDTLKSNLINKLDSSVYAQFGCKNLNSYPYYETTKETHGITFTDNGDGSITASGTNDGTASFISLHDKAVGENFSLILPNGRYILNGCPSNNLLYYITVQILLGGETVVLGTDRGSGIEFIVSGDDHYTDKAEIQIRVVVNKNVALSEPITFYPMIRPAGVADGTWEPYVKSNKQLTTEISGLTNKQNDLSLGVMIDNLNNAGVGCCNYDENATNAPDTNTGIVVTFRNTWNNMVFGLQIAYTKGTPQKVFIRHEWNGGYGLWKEIALS